MKITYLNCDGKTKLFSFHRHDYKSILIDGVEYSLDGGFDYTRCSLTGSIKQDEVKNLIQDIREEFTWTQNYDKNNNRIEPKKALLKDLSSSHICGILSYFTNKLYNDYYKEAEPNIIMRVIDKSWFIIHDIFICELDYRVKNQLI